MASYTSCGYIGLNMIFVLREIVWQQLNGLISNYIITSMLICYQLLILNQPYLIIIFKASTDAFKSSSPMMTEGSYIKENLSKFEPFSNCVRYRNVRWYSSLWNFSMSNPVSPANKSWTVKPIAVTRYKQGPPEVESLYQSSLILYFYTNYFT